MSKIIVSKENNYIYTGLLNDRDKLMELQVENLDKQKIIGNIYIGKVLKVDKGLEAVFVDVGLEQAVFMPVGGRNKVLFAGETSEKPVNQGDDVVVQIIKEGTQIKGPRGSSMINLTGEYAVLTHGNTYIGISNKIDGHSERKRLKQIAMSYRSKSYGFVIRTNAVDVDESDIRSEIEQLIESYQQLMDTKAYRPVKSCLYKQAPKYLNFIRDAYKEDLQEIIVDDEGLYQTIIDSKLDHDICTFRDLGDYSLYKGYDFKKQIDIGLSKRVWLQSGANIVIEPTEALTAIDVNTGKVDTGKKSEHKEDIFLKVNLEAADMVMHQVRLRNLSGIILVDFIDMKASRHNEKLLEYMRELTRKDHIKTDVVDMTALGLVEIARQKVYKPLKEMLED